MSQLNLPEYNDTLIPASTVNVHDIRFLGRSYAKIKMLPMSRHGISSLIDSLVLGQGISGILFLY